ncbi:MAG: SbcC/MukB-like Walker B domain-containing protein [Synergistaceae bacterium]|nr:SbcC/MukB-like Walker B domain-containing protein [Synergistaceae bacterium]
MSGQSELNFIEDEGLGGFRLHRFELLNWGTFDGGVRVISLNGKNALLTGDIGSGKSTIVDAMTTLLISPSRLMYNKAAGAEAKERTLRSYVEGYYKSAREDEGGSARHVGLRKAGSYSVLLGHFHNGSLGADLTLAQVFWLDHNRAQPERLYALAEKDLSIREHFSNFGVEIKGLRKKLREAGIDIFDSYPQYHGAFSRIFGIRSEQALNLFNQTVSMKTIGDLTSFVRSHMLEKFDAASRIRALIGHFDDLTGAHEAALRAKRQVELLTPLKELDEKFRAGKRESEALEAAAAAADCWLAGYKSGLLEARVRELSVEAVKIAEQLRSLAEQKEERESSRAELISSISSEGGGRIQSLEREIQLKDGERDRRKGNAGRYDEIAKKLSLVSCDSISCFAENIERLGEIREKTERERASLQNLLSERIGAKGRLDEEAAEISGELASLRARRSNIEARSVAMRERIAEALSINEDELPFAGELIEVRKEESKWEGAAERLLHNFALSLLVPEEYYKAVSEWVDKNNLSGRLVYFRVREKAAPRPAALPARSLVEKLALKEDSPLFHWLRSEIVSRFNYSCCETMEEFRREPKAVTVNGQIKSNERRHEKDDRYGINDRSRYILGWNNKDKIKLLEGREAALRKDIARYRSETEGLKAKLQTLSEKNDRISKLEYFTAFSDLDWRGVSREIEELNSELKLLRAASRKLDALKKRLEDTERAIRAIEEKRERALKNQAKNDMESVDAKGRLEEERANMTPELLRLHSPSFQRLEALLMKERGKGARVSLENAAEIKKTLTAHLLEAKKRSDAENGKMSNKLTGMMTAFKQEYILETQDFTTEMESLPEYLALLERLNRDDLPRFEAKFRELLKGKTIQEIASFHGNLDKTGRDIEERIRTINEALAQIEYGPGRYIALEAEREKDIVIRQFQNDLRECTRDSIAGESEERTAEMRFAAIEKIIARFRGRPDFSADDRRWTEKVTDVRNWYSFAASERWKEDDKEFEHYSDSSGKSGGQKEKLAYTILAASLAYQFGIDVGGSKARTFRFVIIDEAFARGSDESARFALELFKTLNLQLLIVTPKQKIQVIEPYVSNVTFVSNRDGNSSSLTNMTIEEYYEQKKSRRELDDEK